MSANDTDNSSRTVTLSLTGPTATIAFKDTAVPEQINFGGAQSLNVHKLIGGVRIIDAMGADDAALTWSGVFFGGDAVGAARQLDEVRRVGLMHTLSWDQFRYAVVVSEFKADFKRPFWVQYSITCQVVRDELSTASAAPQSSPSDAISQDCAIVTQNASNLSSMPGANAATANVAQNASVAVDSMSSVTDAAQPIADGLVVLGAPQLGPEVGQVSTLSAAATNAIQNAAAPLAALADSVQAAIGSAEQMVQALPTLGYINPNLPMAGQVNALVAQCNAAAQLPQLYELGAVTTRLQANLALVADPAGDNQIVTGGGNLYQLAAQIYGDATRWSDIAQASDISDPMTTGFNTVTIPQ